MKRPALVLASLLLATHAFAAACPPHPPIHAVRLDGTVQVDGILSEAVWKNAPPITEFFQMDPDQGAPCSQRTEARVAYDSDALYVGVRMFDTAPDSIVARLSRRDESVQSDRFGVYLDPYHDKRSGYYFLVNAAGTVFDGTLRNDGEEDASWDGVWEGRARRDAQGWTAEFRIPFSQVRFRGGDSMVWGLNLRRVIVRRNEQSFLAYQPRNESGFVSRWPDLVDLDGVHASRAIELLPYGTSKAAYLRHAPLDPVNDGRDFTPSGGFDLRTSVGSKLTLNATINPDFGQVEVDPATLNLSDVETFFQEKRPFFVEGASKFRFGNEGASDYWNFNWPEPMFFYSRRVGRAPQGGWPTNADYGDVPVGTTILGAGKVTGKLTPTVNFGTLHALTAREHGDFANSGGQFTSDVEPFTYYGATRVQKEFKDRRQGLGAMTTVVARRFDDARLEPLLNRSSLMGGVDGWVFLDDKKTWVVSGYGAMTNVTGTRERITALQQNPIHYYQRPDASYLGVDTAATSLSGGVARLWLNKEKGRVIANSAVGWISPGFDQTDIGFMSFADIVNAHTVWGYKWSDPGKYRRYFDVKAAAFGVMDSHGRRSTTGFWNGGYLEFNNNYAFNWWGSYNLRAQSYRSTRGGPRMELPPANDVGFWAGTDANQKLYYEIQFDRFARDEVGTVEWSTFPFVEWKPKSNVRVSFGPGYDHLNNDTQYVTEYDDPAATATFGRRYVFAHLHQQTLSANIRLNWAFSPTLSLQTYIQPYVTSGDYRDFRALATPGTYSWVSVPEPFNPDFSYRSLRGNAVFRWEYMPGSALYLVWTQQREDFVNDGTFRFGTGFSEMARAPMDNIFLAKATYYFTM